MSAITWFPVVGCKFSMSHFQFWQILLTFNCRDTVMSHQTLILVVSATFHLIDLGEGFNFGKYVLLPVDIQCHESPDLGISLVCNILLEQE